MQSLSIRLATADESALAGSDGRVEAPLVVENAGAAPCDYAIDIAGLPAAWYDLEPREATLEPGESAAPRLTIHAPQSALGRYPFRVAARSRGSADTPAALTFTLVVGAGGALRVYPGPATMPQREPAIDAEAGAAGQGAAPVARRLPPRLLAFAIPLLLFLLLLGAAVAKRSSNTSTASTAARPAVRARSTTSAGAIGANGANGANGGAGRTVPAGAGIASPTAIAGTLPMIGAVYASETAGAGGAQPARPVPQRTDMPGATRQSPRQATAPPALTPVAPAAPPTLTSVSPAASPAAPPTGPRTAATGAPVESGAVGAQATTTGVAGAQPAATNTALAATRQPSADVALATGPRPATAPVATAVPTRQRSNVAAAPVHLVAAARVVHPAHPVVAARVIRPAHPVVRPGARPGTVKHVVARPAPQRRVVARPTSQRVKPRQVHPPRTRRIVTPPAQQRHRIVSRVQGPRRAAPRPIAQQQRRRRQLARHAQQRRTAQRPQQSQRPAQRRQGQTPTRRAPAARTQRVLRVAWPVGSILHFDRPNALRLSTEPGAAIVVTLRTMIHVRGVDGRELVQPYHATLFAVADRYGQATVPLRYAYIPARPTPGTLTVVARTAHGMLERNAPITLMRR